MTSLKHWSRGGLQSVFIAGAAVVLLGCGHGPPIETAPAPAPTPVKPAQPPADPEAWRTGPPLPGPLPQVNLPTIERGTLPNGLEIFVVERRGLPLVAMNLVVFAGAERIDRNAEQQAGLADFVADLLDEGTKRHSAPKLAAKVEALGAELRTAASYDAAFVRLVGLKDNWEKGLSLVAEIAMTPVFKKEDVERIRKVRLTSILQERDQPPVIARNVASRSLYPAEHAYGYPMVGVEKTVTGFDQKTIRSFYERYYVPGNAKLIVVGDVSMSALIAAAKSHLGKWRGKAVPPSAIEVPSAPDAGERRVHIVDKPGASQSVVSVAEIGVNRKSDDYIPLLVMNYILGGSFSSRINLNLRERNGYSYGARSSFAFYHGRGPFLAGGNVRADATVPAITEIIKEIDAMRSGSVSDDELAEARSSLAGKLVAKFETYGQLADMVAELVVYDLPLDWYAHFSSRLAAVTSAEVLRVAKQYLHPEHCQIVVVGDSKALGDKLTSAKLGSIVEHSANGGIAAPSGQKEPGPAKAPGPPASAPKPPPPSKSAAPGARHE